MAAGVGHEINNPLAIILGYLELISKVDQKIPLEIEEKLEKIKLASKRIEQIVSSLRIFSRGEERKTSYSFKVKELLLELELMLKEIYLNDEIDLVFDLDGLEEGVLVKGDRGKFEQALMNLISNARDATEGVPNRRIFLNTKKIKGNLILNVVDNGIGIKEDVIDDIFDPFFTTKEVGKGTGIGLGLVYKYIQEEFNGSVSVKSFGPFKGSSFSITVPILTSSEDLIGNENTLDIPEFSFNLKAIVVDDEEALREILQMQLEDMGVEATCYGWTHSFKGNEILRLFKRHKILLYYRGDKYGL